MKTLGNTLKLASLALIFFASLTCVWMNFKEAQVRSQVARARSDQRMTARALEDYYADHHALPAQVPLKSFTVDPDATSWDVPLHTWDPPTPPLERALGDHLYGPDPGFSAGAAWGLTTPVAYLPALHADPFINIEGETAIPCAYQPYTSGTLYGWLLFSPGPDGDYDISAPKELFDPTRPFFSKRLRLLMHNPVHHPQGDIVCWDSNVTIPVHEWPTD